MLAAAAVAPAKRGIVGGMISLNFQRFPPAVNRNALQKLHKW